MLRQWLIWLLTTIESLCSRLLGRLTPPVPGSALSQLRPPQHWMDMVKRRAPHLLESLPPQVVVNQLAPMISPLGLIGRQIAPSRPPVTPPAAAMHRPPGDAETTFTTTMRKPFVAVTDGQERSTDVHLPGGVVPQGLKKDESSDELLAESPMRRRRSIPTSRQVPRQASANPADAIAPRQMAARAVWEEKEALPLTQACLTPSPSAADNGKRNGDGFPPRVEDFSPLSWPRLTQPNLSPSHAVGQWETKLESDELAWPRLEALPRQAPLSRLSQPANRRKSDAEQRGTRWSE
jgi:hypothetical protein